MFVVSLRSRRVLPEACKPQASVTNKELLFAQTLLIPHLQHSLAQSSLCLEK